MYSFQTPILQFTKPLQSLLSTVLPVSSVTVSSTTTASVSATSVTTQIFCPWLLNDQQVATLTQIMQVYQDPPASVRTIISSNYIGINRPDPTCELDVNGQANISTGLTVQQATGSCLAFMGTSGTLNFDWSALPFDSGTSLNRPAARWQLTDRGNSQTDMNLLTNISSTLSSRMFISGASGNIGINNPSPLYQFDVRGTVSSQCLTSTIGSISTISASLAVLPNASSFSGQYSELSKIPWLSIFNSNTSILNVKLWTGNGTTSGGTVTFYPTSTSSAGGIPIFTNILHADATAWVNTSAVTSVPLFSGKIIASNMSSVTFNGITGAGVLLGGNSVAFVSNGISVSALIIGT